MRPTDLFAAQFRFHGTHGRSLLLPKESPARARQDEYTAYQGESPGLAIPDCEGCKLEIPWYMDFQKKHKKSGLAVVDVSVDEDGWKLVKPFLKEEKANYPIVIGD